MAIASLLLSLGGVSRSSAADPVFEGPVPPATCGPGSVPEHGLQGEVPKADRESGRSRLGYRCNLELTGQYQGEGQSWQNAWYGHCDYFDTVFPERERSPGVQVVDVSDPAHPRLTANLTTPAMLGPWESLKVNQRRGLLGAVAAYSPAGNGPVFFDVYDLTADCAHPVLKASVPVQMPTGHEGNWAPDGRTYYSASTLTGFMSAIDVSDPSAPRLLTVIPQESHGLSVSDDGTRMYVANPGFDGGAAGCHAGTPLSETSSQSCLNGLDILDVGTIQSRGTLPILSRPTIVGSLRWTDGSAAQHTIPITYGGHPYLVFVDEGGSGAPINTQGPAGAARIIDIADDTHPMVVSKLKLAIQMPENNRLGVGDDAVDGLFGYQGHYCTVDRENDPTALACGYFQSGIRVFDIRDPRAPREIAYFNPPAQIGRKAALPGSEHANGPAFAASTLDADWCASQVRFVQDPPSLWAACQDNGLMILRFTNGAYPLPPLPSKMRWMSSSASATIGIEPLAPRGSRIPPRLIPPRRRGASAPPRRRR